MQFLFWFQYENDIGEGASLIYPPEIVSTIRQLYPGDVKNYPPQSRKVRKTYSVWNRKTKFLRFLILLIPFGSLSLSEA